MSSSSNFRTPRRTSKSKKSSTVKKAKAVDLVTGKATVEYFFDPSLVLGKSSSTTPYKQSKEDSLLDSKHLYVPCTIVKHLEDDGSTPKQTPSKGSNNASTSPYEGVTLVKTSDGSLHKIKDSTKLVPLVSPEDYLGVDDVLHLPSVTEASLLHTLRTRYSRDDIYTSAGPILLSVNPYKQIEMEDGQLLYSEQLMMDYRKASGSAMHSSLPPHLFQVAGRALTALLSSGHPSSDMDALEDEDPLMLQHHHQRGRLRNQSVIISGESGAGKTEATKYIMQFLARMTQHGTHEDSLEDRVLSSNPLLETFGNARTLKNDNSSRFGKFIYIHVSTDTGSITGASISNYLLEKTRITHQIEGERNYHIFYQMFAGASPVLLNYFGMENGTEAFSYLGNRPLEANPKDAQDFEETKVCFKRIGLKEDDQRALFGVVAGILHLGNLQFEESTDGEAGEAQITQDSQENLEKACQLLGLESGKVSEAILTKQLNIGGKTIQTHQTPAMAADKRDALAKMIYSNLFLWLVQAVNKTLSSAQQASQDAKTGFIGVLDIYGFECFDANGYEQLLINYCNEKLQRHFNRHLFEVEQELYSSEGVDWTYITFNDNRPCLELIEGGGGVVGILNTLDDAWSGMGTAEEKDIKFAKNLHKLFGTSNSKGKGNKAKGHSYFVTPKIGKDQTFGIRHYAGEVQYNVDGFVEKNMEGLSNALRDVGADSSIPICKEIFDVVSEESKAVPPAGGKRRSTIRGVSVGSQFRSSLQALVAELDCTQPHYIRCIKPNLRKKPDKFASFEVLKQLRYSGMMEAIRIRREGYALREDHESFYGRFSVLLSTEDFEDDPGIEKLVKVLSSRLKVTDADWQIGHSKIFLRRELADKLERLALLRVHLAARVVGRFGRVIARRRASAVISAWCRFRLVMKAKYKKERAVTKIAAAHRRWKQVRQYVVERKAVIKIQSGIRRKLAANAAQKLRDPFGGMTFQELQASLDSEMAKLDKAIERRDYELAEKIETSIVPLKAAVEAKRPMTRAVIESRISEVKQQLDDAVANKEYSACDSLQTKLDLLVAQRAEYPTIEELEQAVKEAEAAVADAVKKRDYAGAAEGQTRIDEAKKRLQEAKAADGMDTSTSKKNGAEDKENKLHGISSRQELESEISQLADRIKESIRKKDFAAASSLQKTLEERENLRSHFPTVSEMQAKLLSAKKQMAEAVAKKDFEKAGELDSVISELETKIASEKRKEIDGSGSKVEGTQGASIVMPSGEVKLFDSRAELESEIMKNKSLVNQAVASRDFQRAEALQGLVDNLEALRQVLPSFSELQAKILENKKAMEKAISEKNFVEAERIHLTVEELEKKAAAEAKGTFGEEKKDDSLKPRISAPRVATIKAGPALALPKKSSGPGDSRSVSSAPNETVTQTSGKPRVVKAAVRTQTTDSTSVHSAPVVRASSSRELSTPPTALSEEFSDISSLHSNKSNRPLTTGSDSKLKPLAESLDERPVAKLRPKKPVTSSSSDTILAVTKLLASKRSAASLILDESAALVGIITDTDITRRVVAKGIDPASSSVSSVMTAKPRVVAMSDPAMDALTTMVENRFRHLPVVDDNGGVVGLLDIAKCLNDAIDKLEQTQSKSNSAAQKALKDAVGKQGGDAAQVAALQALLGPLMAKTVGNQSSPTLRSLLDGTESSVVSPETNLREVALMMTERRKPALIVDNSGTLTGIFGFKDMMVRAVAMGKSIDTTDVGSVMTPHPEFASPDITVLEALQIMHDGKFLNLPVCEDDGTVIGLVDVMDVIYGCGGAEGWKSVFGSAMELDDMSDAGSALSRGSGQPVVPLSKSPSIPPSATDPPKDFRTVSKLRPKKPLIASSEDSILSVSQLLTSKRGDASLIVNSNGTLAGIITDTDITRRVVAKYIDAGSTSVGSVMTANPTCVAMTDSAMDALTTMVENHFRHLPVVDDRGGVVGLLDVAKCLNDAISKLERSENKGKNAAEDALKQVVANQGAGSAQAAAIQALLGPLMAQAFGEAKSPTLRSLLGGKQSTIVSPGINLREVGFLMAKNRKAALVVDESRKLRGVFTFRDMMARAVAKELPLDMTEVGSVMTKDPQAVSPDITVLEALQQMHDGRFLTLPVCEKDGTVVGLVDVMDVIYGCGGADGWRSIFSSAMELDDVSDTASACSRGSTQRSTASTRKDKKGSSKDTRTVANLRPKKPIVSSPGDSVLTISQLLTSKRGAASLVVSSTGQLAGILTETDITRRVVAKFMDPSLTNVGDVMTEDPTCVSLSSAAMDALMTMVENHFRHLPVVDDKGSVVGLLDIARCLNDAITKLEKSEVKNQNAADEALKKVVNQQGGGASQAAALQALLGPLMAQAFGKQTSPTLRSLLEGKAKTTVTAGTSLRNVAVLMTEHKKAAVIVDAAGKLLGTFDFNDMLTRVVAKELPVDSTDVVSVMTPDPEVASPDITVLEALQIMHDHHLLALPVCEDNGSVVGLVDVMDVIYGCGGAEGWKSIFGSAMELDDVSVGSDLGSFHSKHNTSTSSSVRSAKKDTRTVAKLRPRKPLISISDESVLAVTQLLASKRDDSCLIVNSDGGLGGIITGTDITRRVVAKFIDPKVERVASVMTANPKCVATSESAMDALSTMVENHIRHLPVVDDKGSVVGLLDIAKCLNDAISKLEHAKSKSSNAAQDALNQVVNQQGVGSAHTAALQALLGPLMEQALGSTSSPTLKSLMQGKPSTLVRSGATLREVGILMAERRKAAVVVGESGELLGVFDFKDMAIRAVAKELPLDTTPIADVMTEHPESVSPNDTVLEALQVMHDSRLLVLPVCEDDGTVLGLVDVMDVIYGCGGTEGWRSVFSSAMELDDVSDTASACSYESKSRLSNDNTRPTPKEATDTRTVAKLRPKKPILASSEDSILAVTQLLTSRRGKASLIVDSDGGLAGILTDTDITRRVVAKYVDARSTSASTVMTANPTCVSTSDPAMDALTTMVDKRFRHLPVVDSSGGVVGLLDIAKCLNDAITKLEKSEMKKETGAADALKQAVLQQGAGDAHAAALQALLGPLMSQAFGNQVSPTLRSLLTGKPSITVRSDTNLREVGLLMSERRKAALVVDESRHLLGIFTFHDMMARAVSTELPLDTTEVASVMTQDPEFVSPDITVLEALQVMHDDRLLNLPVCEEDGTVVGLVDVMDVIYGCGGAEGWRSIFSNAMDIADDVSDSQSGSGSRVSANLPSFFNKNNAPEPVAQVSAEAPFVSSLPPNIPTTLEFDGTSDIDSMISHSLSRAVNMDSGATPPGGASGTAVFKVEDHKGHTHRIRCLVHLPELLRSLSKKAGVPSNRLKLSYIDDEGDTILISSDECLMDAVKHGRGQVVKLSAKLVDNAFDHTSPTVLIGVVAGLVALGSVALFSSRRR